MHPARAILVVDNDRSVTEAVAYLLRDQGYTTDTASNGSTAVRQLAERVYDLIVSDLHMPGLDGAGLYGQLVQRHPRMVRRILFLTGDSAGEPDSRFLAAYGLPWLRKPFANENLLRTISRLLNEA